MEGKIAGYREAEHDSPVSPNRLMETWYPSNAEYVFFSWPNGRCIAGHKACECSINAVCVCVCVCERMLTRMLGCSVMSDSL